ncbi:MAG: outer membrane protein transport protein, partial [Pseudomonadales bacterium]|nr:outer membrane protein transport protein [Pseudomonadales bacterium]
GVEMDSRTLEYKATQEMLLAQYISTGISVRLLPDVKVNIDVKWTETSIIETNTVTMEEDDEMLALIGTFIEGISANEIVFPAGYEDTWNWGLGIEYDYSDTLSLRFGYEPRRSGIPEDKRDFMTPFGDMTLYSVGFGYKMDATSVFDVALGYGKSVQDIPSGSSTNGNDNRQDNIIYNPYAGLDVHTELTMVMLQMSYRSEF